MKVLNFLLVLLLIYSCTPSENKSVKDNTNKSVNSNSTRVDGGWSPWQDYTRCDAGKTEKMQIRFCNNPTPSGGGTPCTGEAKQKASCLESGNFSAWSKVGGCNQTTGQQKYTRVCLEGSCTGDTEKYESCAVDGKLGSFYRIKSCALDPDTNYYETWRADCNSPYPRNGGTSCPQDPVIEKRPCTPIISSSPTPTGCSSTECLPVNGGWGEWKAASVCDPATSMMLLIRACDNPIPRNGGIYCEGQSSKLQSCIVGCVLDHISYVGVCDSVNTSRTEVTVYTGVGCSDTRVQVPCPQDCVWGDFEPIDDCHQVLGTQTFRRVKVSEAQYGGTACGTPEEKVADCPIQGYCNL